MKKDNDLSHIWTGEKKKRAISSEDLTMRLDLNKKYQNKDFGAWLRKRLQVRNGQSILDVGCGTGAQTIFMLEDVGPSGSVVAFDISDESIKTLSNDAKKLGYKNLTAFKLDMGDISSKLDSDFSNRRFNIAHSSYAIYYSPKRLKVLNEMQSKLTSDGRLAIFTPCEPHGMVDFVSKYHSIPQPVLDSLKFGTEKLIPIFRESFWNLEIHFFQSELKINSAKDFISFYQATTYYEKQFEKQIFESVNEYINKNGYINFSKNGVLLIADSKRKSIEESVLHLNIK